MTINQSETKSVNFKSCFDIIGPIMIGPSSSHTAGAIGIGFLAHNLFLGKPTKAIVTYYESFAETHKGHGTDYAIASGILGFATDDIRVPASLDILKEQNIDIKFIEKSGPSPVGHPNAACITLSDDTETIHVTAISVGGGLIEVKEVEVEGFSLSPQGSLPILLVIYPEGNEQVKAEITNIFLKNQVRVNHTFSLQKDNQVLLEFDLDADVSKKIKDEINQLNQASRVIWL